MIRIIGGGFSGLSLAYFFSKKGYSVTIIEKRNKTGGVIASHMQNGMLIESAANGFLASEKIEEMFTDIGLSVLTTNTESKKKYIFRGGLRRWPLSLGETLSLLSRLIVALVSNDLKPRKNETLKDWATRVLGPSANDYIIQPMVNGIFAQDTAKLSARLVLGSILFKKKKKRLRGLISAAKGMGEVMQKLEEYLKTKGVVFEFETEEKNIQLPLQHNTFLAINFSSIISRFAHFNIKKPVIKSSNLTSLSLARITISFKNSVDQIKGFGVLFPNKQGFSSLGVLANTKIFSHRGDYNESWILGDSVLPELMNLSDEQILEKILVDRKRIFPAGSNPELNAFSIHRWPAVIPSYDLSLEDFLDSNSDLVAQLTGNYLGVLGLTGIHERNYQLVEAYSERNRK